MLLATVAHRAAPHDTTVAHAVSPAVPAEGTERVRAWAAHEGWRLEVIASGEFDDEQYLSNPVNRCYFCKSHLYTTLSGIAARLQKESSNHRLLSGANLDDLGEYRPGLVAASEHEARHPFVEAKITTAEIRQMARALDLQFAELPASPCLASRLYTGTRVTAARLKAIEAGEALIRRATGLDVVRCRLREQDLMIEVMGKDRPRITADLIAAVASETRTHEPSIRSVVLDSESYRPGRAFVGVP
jgi:uncharacterized protein